MLVITIFTLLSLCILLKLNVKQIKIFVGYGMCYLIYKTYLASPLVCCLPTIIQLFPTLLHASLCSKTFTLAPDSHMCKGMSRQSAYGRELTELWCCPSTLQAKQLEERKEGEQRYENIIRGLESSLISTPEILM